MKRWMALDSELYSSIGDFTNRDGGMESGGVLLYTVLASFALGVKSMMGLERA